jgi:predicted peptidase
MMTRREALALFGSIPAALALRLPVRQGDAAPPLAPGAPKSPQRTRLIDHFKEVSAGLETRFESREHKADWTMPYRLFRPDATPGGTTKHPLVVYLHGSGGLGADNEKQMGLGNVFGTRVWALPENQKTFPCYVIAPQTDRGWVKYGDPAPGDSVARVVPGLGDGARLAFAIIDALQQELPIDERRIYITGQSMGGAGVWHMVAQRPRFFAAAAVCCGSATLDSAADAVGTPLWNFHGDADQTVPVAVSRARIAALRKAGGHPVSTEYPGVGHNVWEWAYTEPSLVRWVSAQRRA